MTLPVSFLRAARAEFNDAAAWYEAQHPGLGDAFIAEIERCAALAAQHPNRYAVVHHDIRRIPTRRFPFALYFRAERERIVVLAVFHSRRDPAVWRGRA